MAAATEGPFVLPGEAIDPSLIPTHPKRPLRLGPGLRHIPPAEIVPTVAGKLVINPAKPSLSLDYNGGRYVPEPNDLVIGQVHHSSADFHFVTLAPHTTNALLPVLAFEGATRKTRPVLPAGSLVYARVASASRHMDAELECVSQTTGKADGLGPLNPPAAAAPGAGAAAAASSTGTVFNVSLGMARRLLMPQAERDAGLVVLDALAAEGLAFETAVGRNGKVWVASESVPTLVLVGRALAEVDEKGLSMDAQRKLVKKLVREMS
ncbi:hypothetical protein MCOR25_007745 [Pyricularia grisea]|uniref:Ribosomal RNA-processing protein 40 n=1 Tax=Pyricularia grisea TaxID=148305 RepID=A0A6P8AXA0_PYRGI|nr:hypothetical protein PgNI_10532 [Pyricularia grisea]KAI6357102.1 hypothetical protein MCOR25_007745 [Pyricularia grisea]TLD06916.1 hypothetical protein PgNI_10532 [Pyricularia grisea]